MGAVIDLPMLNRKLLRATTYNSLGKSPSILLFDNLRTNTWLEINLSSIKMKVCAVYP